MMITDNNYWNFAFIHLQDSTKLSSNISETLRDAFHICKHPFNFNYGKLGDPNNVFIVSILRALKSVSGVISSLSQKLLIENVSLAISAKTSGVNSSHYPSCYTLNHFPPPSLVLMKSWWRLPRCHRHFSESRFSAWFLLSLGLTTRLGVGMEDNYE